MNLMLYLAGDFSAVGGIMKHLAALTFVLQFLGFIGLLGFVVYEFFSTGKTTEEDKRGNAERKAGEISLSADKLPKLDPINCPNCGAGVPLRENGMICPSCGTKTSAPENYFDVANSRGEINVKIRRAAAYLKRAEFLSSAWVRYATALLALWLAFSFIAAVVLINKGNFAPYQAYFSDHKPLKLLLGVGSFANWFWVISLLFGFAVWSPRVRKALPSVELNEKIGKPEIANCSQCGGAISYLSEDLATVCGYCGVETYRAAIAWKLRDLTNEADRKANFSLLEARRAVEDAISETSGTPKAFAFLLILIAGIGAVMWLVVTAYDSLPVGVKKVFEFIGDILDAF